MKPHPMLILDLSISESYGSLGSLVAQLKASCCPLPGSLFPPALFISPAWTVKITISHAGNPASKEEELTNACLVWNLSATS